MTDTSYLYQYFMEKSIKDKEHKSNKDDARPIKRANENPKDKDGNKHE